MFGFKKKVRKDIAELQEVTIRLEDENKTLSELLLKIQSQLATHQQLQNFYVERLENFNLLESIYLDLIDQYCPDHEKTQLDILVSKVKLKEHNANAKVNP